MSEYAILIPAYKPVPSFPKLIKELSTLGFDHLVVVDDGGGDEYAPVFSEITDIDNVTVLHHAVNLGKGAALKTGLNHCYAVLDVDGVVTADADGQHLPQDIKKVAEVLQQTGDRLILGSREFPKDVPLRSRFGNIVTKHVFRLLLGTDVRDTQTGLRGIPRDFIPELLKIRSNRYEFEMEMLIHTVRSGHTIEEHTISTVYIDDNESSHFNPLLDSLKIYFALLRFSVSSLLTYVVDFTVFVLTFKLTGMIGLANAVARLVALPVYFFLTRDFVFHAQDAKRGVVLRYLLIVFVSGLISYLSQTAILHLFATPEYANKIVVETVMFFINFLLLRDFVYSKK